MPTSSKVNKDWIAARFNEHVADDARILDVGPGNGTYSALLARPSQTWIGVEAFERYLTDYNLAKKYDQLFVSDIRRFHYAELAIDAVIFGDVLEHMDQREAFECVRYALQYADDVFISCPIGRVPQGAWGGNEFERHRHDWDHFKFLDTFKDHLAGSVMAPDPKMRNIEMGAYHLKS